jgi:ElaB/YqjD/DUF883 family membrane-anchored ribosome-binding protein
MESLTNQFTKDHEEQKHVLLSSIEDMEIEKKKIEKELQKLESSRNNLLKTIEDEEKTLLATAKKKAAKLIEECEREISAKKESF